MEFKNDFIKYSPEELEGTRKYLWRKRFQPILYEFLELRNGMKILDIGCGTGFFTRMLASQIKGEIIGIDIDEDLLKKADKLTKRENLDIRYLKQDAYNLEFDDDYFDLVTSHIVLCNLKDTKKALLEMKRVSKNKVVAIEPCNSGSIQFYGNEPEAIEFQEIISKAKKGYDNEMVKMGSDLDLGPKLPYLFFEIGLKNVDVEEYSMINFSSKRSSKRLRFELDRLKEAVPKYISSKEFERILYLSKTKKSALGSISTLPLFLVKGAKYG